MTEQDPSSGIIASKMLLETFRGVAVATKASDALVQEFEAWIAPRMPSAALKAENNRQNDDHPAADCSVSAWSRLAALEVHQPELHHLITISVAIGLMRTKIREKSDATPEELEMVWLMIHKAIMALVDSSVSSLTVSRSAQGFLVVPLCSLLVNGNIDELWRFHFWLADGTRPAHGKGWGIHSHQAFAQSWILAGKGEDIQYSCQAATSKEEATHAVFSLDWTDAAGSGTVYKTHQTHSTVVNTGTYVRVEEVERATHAYDMTYTIPAATLHSSMVAPDAVHATLFVFDAKRGFVQDAPVLGPPDQQTSTQVREVAGTTAAELAKTTTFLRSVEKLLEKAKVLFRGSDLEDALHYHDRALHLCTASTDIPVAEKYQQKILPAIASIYRRSGRYETAIGIMGELLRVADPKSSLYIGTAGEMSVAYRHMNDLEQAKHMAQTQYDTARSVHNAKHMCRAAGTLGILNYQLYLRDGNEAFLDTAINQLEERIHLAKQLAAAYGSYDEVRPEDATDRNSAITRWLIGLGRLANCRIVRGETTVAVELTREALELSQQLTDSTVIALSNLFHGRALAKDGQHERAMAHFNSTDGCLPAIALCREPSEEHLGYLSELADFGADFDRVDEHGYSALDYAEFNGDKNMGEVVIRALRRSLADHPDHYIDEEIARRQRESQLRKGYRMLFQEELRPVLLKGGCNERTLHSLRHTYANALRRSPEKTAIFDHLKYMRYKDFLAFGRIPRSSDTLPGSSTMLARRFGDAQGLEDGSEEELDFIIFFSYRWINANQTTRSTPDDDNSTMYNRMKGALASFLEKHPHLSQDRLGIWIDHVCVDQANPLPGISALPLIITQCNALISLIDDSYRDRAWCSVEVMIISALRRAYGLHFFYEHILNTDGTGSGKLVAGSDQPVMSMKDKHLTFEEDRPIVMFLARQSRFLG